MSLPRLDEDVHLWLDHGSYKGEMAEAVWDDEGEMLKLPPRPAKWLAPDVDSSTHRYSSTLLDRPAVLQRSTI